MGFEGDTLPSDWILADVHLTGDGCKADELDIYWHADGVLLRVRVPPGSTDGGLTAIETINAPGFGPPLHRHPQTEIFYVLEGRYLFEVNGKRFHGEAGEVVTVPGGESHAFVNVTDKPARQFILIVPGLDAVTFFAGLAGVMRGGKPDTEALNAFGTKWQVDFLGPPLRAG